MTDRTRTLGAALALALAVALAPMDAHAQGTPGDDRPLSVDARAGIALPFGDLGDVADPGPSFGLGVAYRIHPRISLRVDGDLDLMGGADFDATSATQPAAPDLKLWHFSGGAELDVTRPGLTRWHVTANAGLGATTIDTDPFVDGPVENPETGQLVADLDETYFTLNGGVNVSYDVHERVDVFGAAQWYLSFADEDETAVFSALSPTEANAFDSFSSVPVTVGVRLAF